MKNNKFAFCLILALVLGLCAILLASDRDVPLKHNQSWMNKLHSVPKEAKPPFPPDFKRTGEEQKPCQTSATAGSGAIRGRITQAPGGTTPIEDVTILAWKSTCPSYFAGAYSDSDGYYIIESLPDGKYEVYTDNDSIFVDLYWNNKPIWGEPDTVSVVSNDTTPNIDFSLRVGGKITGRVTMPGAFFTSVTVYAKDTLSLEEYSGYADILLDSASYEIRKLPSGFYKVNTANSDSFVDEYYSDKPDWTNADPVSVTEGATTSGIDFSLALGGKITGTVTMPGATEVFVAVWALNTVTGEYYSGYGFNPLGSSASYEIVGLRTGSYKVSTFNDLGYLDEYYNDRPDETSADLVLVTQGSATPNIDFTLTLGGIIKGTVTSYAKGPLEGIKLIAFSTSNQHLGEGYGTTDASGHYRIDGLKTGKYKILAYGDSVYAWEYYNGKPSWSSADSVLVTAADSVSGKDFTLDIGGMITGYIYGDGAIPISGAVVLASGTSYQSLVSRSDVTSADGSYKLGGLRTGYYWVGASIECFEMWYDNKTIFELPDSVYVTMPDTTSGINFNFPSAVGGEEIQIPSRPVEFELSQNYPNPFNPTTAIAYTLQKKAVVNLEIYNLLGQRVKTLVNEYQSPGSYHILWDGRNEQEETVASGIYFYRLVVDGVPQTKRMVLLK